MPMAGRQRFAIPEGWVARGFRFEVEPTTPEQLARIAQHFGARRFAYNWTLAQVAETRYKGDRLMVRRTRLQGAQAELFPDWRYHRHLTHAAAQRTTPDPSGQHEPAQTQPASRLQPHDCLRPADTAAPMRPSARRQASSDQPSHTPARQRIPARWIQANLDLRCRN